MEKLPDEVLGNVIDFIGFGETLQSNILCYRHICKRLDRYIRHHIRFEIDHDQYLSVLHFATLYHQLYMTLVQKRNSCVDWDDHRGFLIIQDYDFTEWNYYDRLIQTYYFRGRNKSFPHYKGQMYFYEYPSFL